MGTDFASTFCASFKINQDGLRRVAAENDEKMLFYCYTDHCMWPVFIASNVIGLWQTFTSLFQSLHKQYKHYDQDEYELLQSMAMMNMHNKLHQVSGMQSRRTQ